MSRPVRSYSAHGLAGCVTQRRARTTDRLVGVYHAEQAGLCTEGGAWVTVCEEHGTTCSHRTLALACEHSAEPSGWCADCAEQE